LSIVGEALSRMTLVRDEGILHERGGHGLPESFAFVPERRASGAGEPLVVAVHGVSREARQQIELLRPCAEAAGLALLAPLFDAETFADYQRLGRRSFGPRADLALIELIERFEERSARRFDRLLLVGYSGGAQFVHRFVMAHPERVAAAVCAAAGWYTTPDRARRFPRGLRTGGLLPGVRLEPRRFLRVPTLVAVGAQDLGRDESVRTEARLDAEQGRNRVERARTWVRAMREAAERCGLASRIDYVELPGVAHSFPECVEAGLDRVAFEFFESILLEEAAT